MDMSALMRQGRGGGNKGHRGQPGLSGQNIDGAVRLGRKVTRKPGSRGKRRMKR